ncbi:MAG: hypothetical protein ABW321_02735 [Polyangiales bacterium]
MTTRMIKTITLLGFAVTGCATNFTGSAHIEGGRAACEQKCNGQGLAMSGLVYMGEYSSACVCSVPGAGGGNAAAMASVAAGAAGVVMQNRENQSRSGGFVYSR